MQPLDQGQRFEIVRLDVIEPRLTLGRLDRFRDGLHHDAPVWVMYFRYGSGPCFPALLSREARRDDLRSA